MTATNDIPRIGPAHDDGAGLPFVVTYRLDDDERDEWTALCAALDREAVLAEAAAIVRAQRQSAMSLRRDRENAAALDQLHGREPFWVDCPECEGRGVVAVQRGRDAFWVTCAACDGRQRVSPLFASTWERRGI